jgi:hypothetical protein
MRRFLPILIPVLFFLAIPVEAAQLGGGSIGGLDFTCPPESDRCSCDGSYVDCKDMKDLVCKDGKMSCGWINGQAFCQCTKKNARVAPIVKDRPAAPMLKK